MCGLTEDLKKKLPSLPPQNQISEFGENKHLYNQLKALKFEQDFSAGEEPPSKRETEKERERARPWSEKSEPNGAQSVAGEGKTKKKKEKRARILKGEKSGNEKKNLPHYLYLK